MKRKDLSDKEMEQLLEKLSQSTHSPQGEFSAENSYLKLEKRMKPSKGRKITLFKSVAAAVVLLVASFSTYLYLSVDEPAIIRLATTDTIKELTLPDGTHVTLSRYSSLEYPEKFTNDSRDVTIEGEAFFDVTKDKHHPFIVHASTIQVEVLGTQFDVRAYTDDPYIRTTLLEGSVAVSHTGDSARTILEPNQMAIFHKATETISTEIISGASDEVAWRKGHHIFNDKSLLAISNELSSYFNTPIQITDSSLQAYKLTARFEQNESLDEILNLLQHIGHFSWERINNEIIIHSK